MRRVLPIVALAVLLLGPAASAAAQGAVVVHEVEDDAVRVDGSLRDWRHVRFVDVGSGGDASMEFALRNDSNGLYLAATVRDERMVRTGRLTSDEDAIVITLAMPAGRRYRAHDVWLYAGVPGRQGAAAAIAPVGRPRLRTLEGARVVEGPLRGARGYVLEAFVPFARVPGADDWQRGRLAVRLRDVDSEAHPEVESEPSFGRVDPRHLDRLPAIEATGGEAGMLRRLLRARGLTGTRPRHDLRGDVAGDGRPERVVVVETALAVMGEGYRNGESFELFQLPVATSGQVRSAALRDLTGDGEDEIVVTLRQSNELGSRDLWQVYSVTAQDIRPLFGIETRKQTDEGWVQARLRVRRARQGAPVIEVRVGRSEGLDAESFREAPAHGVESILLPWGPVLARTYQWDGERLAVVRERDNPRHVPAGERREREPTERRVERREPEPPTPPGVDELVAAFRREAGIGRGVRPRFRQTANVAESPAHEQVMVFGNSLLVVGPEFRGGTGWFHFGLPVERADHVLHVGTADLTGDGREEVIVCVRRATEDVWRELLLVHQFRPSGFPRLLAAEVAREQGDDRVESRARVIPRRGAHVLEIRPGRSRGWNASTWPFTEGTGDAVDPLLLPWRDEAVRYRFEGGRLVR